MFELDELGELAWVPVVLLAAVMAWRSRSALLAGLGGSGRLALRGAQAGLPGNWITGPVAAFRWALGIRQTSGNGSFDVYRDDALRRLEDEQREFRAFLARLHQARDRSEFDAYMAERAR